MNKITWPQFCRAQSAAAAYKEAIALFTHKPHDVAVALLTRKLEARSHVCDRYAHQQSAKRVAQADEEYHAQAALTDEGESDE